MTELEVLERTLNLARAGLSPSSADDQRARAALGLTPPALPDATRDVAAGASGWAALRASGKAGMLVGMVLLGAGVGVGYALGRGGTDGQEATARAANVQTGEPPAVARAHDEVPPRSAPSVPTAMVIIDGAASTGSASSVESDSVEGLERRKAVVSAVRARQTSSKGKGAPSPLPRGAPPVSDSADELALLRRVEKSLRSNDAGFALALLDELEQRFPRTQLSEERAAASAMAHCALGNPGARLRGEIFSRAHADSVYAERVQAACSVPTDPNAAGDEGAPAPGHE